MRKMWKSVIAAVFTLSTVVSSVVMPTAVSAADAAIPLPELRVEGFESYAAGTALDVRYPVNGGLYYTNNTATAAVIETVSYTHLAIPFSPGALTWKPTHI